MKHRTASPRKALYTFSGGIFLAGILFIALLAGCPNAGLTPEAPSYTSVALSELDAWLQAKPAGGPYCIEVTELTADDLKGSYQPSNASPLGKILKKYPDKLVALKLPANVEGLNNMYNCFRDCVSLVSVQTIPAGVTSIYCCFYGCSSLKQAPVIPSGVTNMGSCFINCSSLEQAPAIPSGVNSMGSCFMGCSSLDTGTGYSFKCNQHKLLF